MPNEIIHLKDDELLIYEDNLLITKWKTLKPRKDIDHGVSAYFLDMGFKISKIYDRNDTIVYWYCDIIHTVPNPLTNSIVFHDLLVDVVVYENGSTKVLDLDELGQALTLNLIDTSTLIEALDKLNSLLNIIYSNNFNTLTQYIENIEATIIGKHSS